MVPSKQPHTITLPASCLAAEFIYLSWKTTLVFIQLSNKTLFQKIWRRQRVKIFFLFWYMWEWSLWFLVVSGLCLGTLHMSAISAQSSYHSYIKSFNPNLAESLILTESTEVCGSLLFDIFPQRWETCGFLLCFWLIFSPGWKQTNKKKNRVTVKVNLWFEKLG